MFPQTLRPLLELISINNNESDEFRTSSSLTIPCFSLATLDRFDSREMVRKGGFIETRSQFLLISVYIQCYRKLDVNPTHTHHFIIDLIRNSQRKTSLVYM